MTTAKSHGAHGNVKAEYNTGARVPEAVKKLRGTYDKHNEKKAAQRAGAESPEELMQPIDVPAELLEPPETLCNNIAIDEWRMFIVPLIKADVIKLTDLRIAELYCDLWGMYQSQKTLYNDLSDGGERPGQAAEQGVYFPMKLADKLTKIMQQMGLTPVSRGKVVRMMREKGQVQDSDWARILNPDA